MTRLLIIGFPVSDSPAEAVQQAALKAAGRDVRIERWERKAHQLSEALGSVVDPDVAGAMIGSPHKERAASFIGLLADEARASGAVNLAVNQDGRLHGYNTDVAGVRAGLETILPESAARWPRQAGVAGRRRARSCRSCRKRIPAHRRLQPSPPPGEAVVAHLTAPRGRTAALPWRNIIESELSRARLVVNASGGALRLTRAHFPPIAAGRAVVSTSSSPMRRRLLGKRQSAAGVNGQALFLWPRPRPSSCGTAFPPRQT